MIGLRFLIGGICGLALSTICASVGATDTSPPLFGPNASSFWSLVSFADGPQNSDAIFVFEGATFSLDVPCFRKPWGYRYDGAFTPISIDGNYTDRCPGMASSIVAAFDAMMPKVRLLRLNGDLLSLVDSDDRTLLLLRRLQSTGLENRKWHILEFFDGTSLVATREHLSHPWSLPITFVHGDIDGSAGCGALFGHYDLNGSHVTLGTGSILAGFCYPKDIETNGLVLTALNGERILQQEVDRLTLRDSQGRIQVVLTPWSNDQP